MGWESVGNARKAVDDTSITDDQQRKIARLQEKLDGVPFGTYGNLYTMTRIEASRYITELEQRWEKRRARRIR